MDSQIPPAFPIAIAHRDSGPTRIYRWQILLDHPVLPTTGRFHSIVLNAAFLLYRRAAVYNSTLSAYWMEQRRSEGVPESAQVGPKGCNGRHALVC